MHNNMSKLVILALVTVVLIFSSSSKVAAVDHEDPGFKSAPITIIK